MASSSSSASPTPTNSDPAAAVAKKGFLRRIFPLFLAANLAAGVYVLARTLNKELPEEQKEKVVSSTPVAESAATANTVSTTPSPVTVKTKPIPEKEQLELYKWILEEKRKVKPENPSEKKKIDEEKALLKQIIRSGSVPAL